VIRDPVSSLGVNIAPPLPYFAPQKQFLEREFIGVFNPNSQNIKTCMLLKNCNDSKQILHSDKDHKIPF